MALTLIAHDEPTTDLLFSFAYRQDNQRLAAIVAS
jgi:hypothetical protein